MRLSLATAALVFALVVTARAQSVLGLSGPAQVRTGTVISLDSASGNFVVQDRTTARQYWTSRGTLFHANRPSASFFDLAIGQRVQVVFHNSGPLAIADLVTF